MDPRTDDPDLDDALAIRRPSDARESSQANRHWWDAQASEYYLEHSAFLGDQRFVWGPEGLDEAVAGLLADVSGQRVLEVGAGAAQCSRWLVKQGALAVATDLSGGMLRQGVQIDVRLAAEDPAHAAVPLVQCDACTLPFADDSIDLACSSYGAVPFVADSARLMAEVARVLRPGGRWVFSTSHPVRWSFLDEPGADGLLARASYFDRTPYVEQDEEGRAVYVEHHRTLGDRIRELTAAGFVLEDLVEPEWPAGHEQVWGGWSPLRGRLIPGTAIFCCRLP